VAFGTRLGAFTSRRWIHTYVCIYIYGSPSFPHDLITFIYRVVFNPIFFVLGTFPFSSLFVCMFITAVPILKLFAWGEGDSGGHVLRETTSRGLCGLVCPSNYHHALVNAGEREIV
jgi:hypothetical protein